MSEVWQEPTLVGAVRYQIRVPGELDDSWSMWYEELKIVVESTDQGASVTVLAGTFDQAALHGLLRRLYSLGLPLISVNCVDFVKGDVVYTRGKREHE